MATNISHTCRTCDATIRDAGLTSACAACGVRIGAETHIIRESKPAATVLLVMGIVLFVIAVGEKPFGRWEPHQILALGFCVLMTWFFVSMKPHEAILWELAVVLLEKGNPPRQIGWSGIAQIRANHEENRIEFLDNDNRLTDSIPVEFFGTWRRAERFVREAQAYLGPS